MTSHSTETKVSAEDSIWLHLFGRRGKVGHGGGEVLEDGVKCQCCASVIEGIADITGILSPEPTRRFLCSLASRFFMSNGQRVHTKATLCVKLCNLMLPK